MKITKKTKAHIKKPTSVNQNVVVNLGRGKGRRVQTNPLNKNLALMSDYEQRMDMRRKLYNPYHTMDGIYNTDEYNDKIQSIKNLIQMRPQIEHELEEQREQALKQIEYANKQALESQRIREDLANRIRLQKQYEDLGGLQQAYLVNKAIQNNTSSDYNRLAQQEAEFKLQRIKDLKRQLVSPSIEKQRQVQLEAIEKRRKPLEIETQTERLPNKSTEIQTSITVPKGKVLYSRKPRGKNVIQEPAREEMTRLFEERP